MTYAITNGQRTEGNKVSVPTVTITVTGESAGDSVDVDTLVSSLHMVYLQAVDGKRRYQWIVFPPAVSALGVDAQKVASSTGRVRVLVRVQEFEGNRSKWFHRTEPGTFLSDAMEKAVTDGHKVSPPVLVPLELDDYLKVWEGETSHKAIRAVDRTIQTVLKTTTK